MSNSHDGSYNHLLHQNPASAMVFLFSERLSAALEPTVRHHVSPAASIEELRRFIAIKAFVTDTDGTKVQPTPFMDDLWKAVILDTVFYNDLQTALGCTLHRPIYHADEATTGRQEIRLKTMQSLYTNFFGSQPLEAPAGILHQSNTTTASAGANEERITFFIHSPQHERITIKARSTTKMSKIYQVYSEQNGVPLDSYHLKVDGTIMHPDRSLSDYDIETGDSVEIMVEQRGC